MTDQKDHRIAITGMGLVGPYGLSAEELWSAQGEGDAPFHPATRYSNGLPAAESVPVDLRKMLKTGQLSRAPLISQYAIAAAQLALEEAGMVPERGVKTGAVGIVFGTSNGPGAATQQIYDDLIDTGPVGVKPRVFQESVFNAPASFVSIHFGFQGPIQVIPVVGNSGAAVLYQAQLMLAQPGVEVVVALCSEELCDAIQRGFSDLHWQADYRDDGSIGPGAVMSEGAVALILERVGRAEARGAKVLAELGGVGLANDAAELARPSADGRGLVVAIEEALGDAGVEVGTVDMVLTGSVGTEIEDRLEASALSMVFARVPPSGSSKRSTGFAMGASALVEVALAVAAVGRGAAPASVRGQPENVKTVLCNAIGLNGQFGATLIRSAA